MGKYDDIIYYNYSGSKRYDKMSMINRGAQFAPFAALNGHEEAIDETARLVDKKIELTNDEKINISNTLNDIDYLKKYKITYFIEDINKVGGMYRTIYTGIKKIDEYNHLIILEDKTKIKIDNIYDIELSF